MASSRNGRISRVPIMYAVAWRGSAAAIMKTRRSPVGTAGQVLAAREHDRHHEATSRRRSQRSDRPTDCCSRTGIAASLPCRTRVWLAYRSNLSGRSEVYVQPYPGPGPRTQVSVDGGRGPAWHPNRNELFFVSLPTAAGTSRMMVATFDPGPPLRVAAVRSLFEYTDRELHFSGGPVHGYDIAPDGQRFFVAQNRPFPSLPPVTHINLIENWLEELKAKVSTGR